MLWDQSADELVLTGDSKLSFHDAAGGENIIATSNGHLEVNAGTTLDMTAPTIDINGTTEVQVDTPTFDVNGTTAVTIDCTNTSNGVAIGTSTSGVPISIGHSTSETTVNDNLTVTGDFTVNGTTTTIDSTTIHITSSFTFEGTSPNAHETVLGVVNPTADATIKLPAMAAGTYYTPVLSAVSTTAVSSTPEELNLLDGSSAGTVVNSKAVIYSSDGDIAVGDNLTLTSDSSLISLGDGADATLTHDGTTGLTIAATPISINSTGDLTLSGSDIILDASGADILFKDDGTLIGGLNHDGSSNFVLSASVMDKDIVFKGSDNNSAVTALTLDMSDAGHARLNSSVSLKEQASALADTAAYGQIWVKSDTPNDLYFTNDAGNDVQITDGSSLAATGDITGVTAGNGLSGGGTSGGVTLNVEAAQTVITSLLATDIKIGEDDETKIDFETANEIHFYANNVEQVYVADNIFGPQSDSDVDLGTTGVRWKDAFVDSLTVTAAIGGGTTVSGSGAVSGLTGTFEEGLSVGGSTVVSADKAVANVTTVSGSGAVSGLTGTFEEGLSVGNATVISADKAVANVTTISGSGAVSGLTGTFEEGVTVGGSVIITADKALTNVGAVGCGAITSTGNAIFGVDDTGVDVRFFSETASEGVFYDASEDELGLLLTTKLKFHDIGGGEEIYASANGHLEVNAGTTLDMTAPTVDVNASTAVTLDTPSVVIASSTANKPRLELKNTASDTNSAILRFVKDKGAAGAANDNVGIIEFYGDDAAQEQVLFGRIRTRVAVHTDGQEGGKMQFAVASHDGELQPGLTIGDGSAEDEVDVTLGNGAASLVAVAGLLSGAAGISGLTGTFEEGLSVGNATVISADKAIANVTTISGSAGVSGLTGTFEEGVTVGGSVIITADKALTNVTAITSTGDLSVTGDTITLASANANDPLVVIKNTTNDTDGARLRFVMDKGSAGADDDVAGLIEFYADDDNQDNILFAKITAQVADASNGAEGGKLSLGVATHDGEFQNGLILADGSAEDEIDVTIGNGAASVVSAPGFLSGTVGLAGLALTIGGAANRGIDEDAAGSLNGLNVNSGGITNAGAVSGVSTLSGSGAAQAFTFAAEGGFKMGSTAVITEDLQLRAKQIHTTRHHFENGSNANFKYISFANQTEASTALYINSMVVPFDGRLVRAIIKPEDSQNGDVTIFIQTGSAGEFDINGHHTIEHVVVSMPDAAAVAGVFNTSGSQHFAAGEIIGLGIKPNAAPGRVSMVCIWEYDMTGL